MLNLRGKTTSNMTTIWRKVIIYKRTNPFGLIRKREISERNNLMNLEFTVSLFSTDTAHEDIVQICNLKTNVIWQIKTYDR